MMNYKDRLFFVGKCLSLAIYPERVEEIRLFIRSKEIDWEQIVWLGSNHYVLPAFYLNLKRAGLLTELPEELAQYLEEITSQNRERNLQIIIQAKEVTKLLNSHGITPVFLKGTAHLLNGLYADIAERMVGDIDFLVNEDDVIRAAEILMYDGYFTNANPELYLNTYHITPLRKENRVSHLEIHRQPIHWPCCKEFSNKYISKNKMKLNIDAKAFVPSVEHQIISNILHVQFLDLGFKTRRIFLRQIYDFFLLTNNKNPLDVISDLGHYFNELNAYIALSSKLLGNPKHIIFKENKKTKRYLCLLFFLHKHTKFHRIIRIIINYYNKITQSFYKKEVRKVLLRKLSNPSWYKKHLVSLKRM